MILHDKQSNLDWHIIESEADLPTEYGEYMVTSTYDIENGTMYCESCFFDRFNREWWTNEAIAWRELTDIERGIGLTNVTKQIIEPSEEEDEVEEVIERVIAKSEPQEELGQMSLQF